jgi:hypothetical protein
MAIIQNSLETRSRHAPFKPLDKYKDDPALQKRKLNVVKILRRIDRTCNVQRSPKFLKQNSRGDTELVTPKELHLQFGITSEKAPTENGTPMKNAMRTIIRMKSLKVRTESTERSPSPSFFISPSSPERTQRKSVLYSPSSPERTQRKGVRVRTPSIN